MKTLAKNKNGGAPDEKDQNKELRPNGENTTSVEENGGANCVENECEKLLTAEKDRYLRLAAEYDNFRKRSAKERDMIFTEVRSDTISRLLPVYDNIARALVQECSDSAYYKGIELIFVQLKEIFEEMGVTEIPAVGESFDPELHNAVMHVEDDSFGPCEVAEEFEKGFRLGDKIIRYSAVKVAN
jgi:molecular chaperone GrpE